MNSMVTRPLSPLIVRELLRHDRIDAARRLVEDERPRAFQQRASNREPLTLAAGQPDTALTDFGLVSSGQRLDDAMNLGHLACRHHLLEGGVWIGELQVVEDGACGTTPNTDPVSGARRQRSQSATLTLRVAAANISTQCPLCLPQRSSVSWPGAKPPTPNRIPRHWPFRLEIIVFLSCGPRLAAASERRAH